MRHAIIRVGATHCGALPPGLLVAIPIEKVTMTDRRNATFENPCGGFSFGEAVAFVDIIPDGGQHG